MEIEITDFKNFAQFLAYSQQHIEEMKNWPPEKMKEYLDKVSALRENNPEFKRQYDEWTKKLERQQKKPITIGGTEKETERSRAMIKLKEAQNRQKNKKMNLIEIVRNKKQYKI